MGFSAFARRIRATVVAAALAAVLSPQPRAGAQVAPPDTKAGPAATAAEPEGDDIVGPGYRRVFVTQHQPISPASLVERTAAGKPTEIDPADGRRIVRTFVDHLPKNWLLERPAGLPADLRIDSLGNPIVNDTPGLPAWAQRDVDALRAAIAQSRDQLKQLGAAGADVREAESVLGNYVGQAITRAIPIDDLLDIDDPAQLTPGAAASVLAYMHFYENVRWANQPLFRYEYARTEYPDRILAFVQARGSTMQDVQALESEGLRGGAPSGCYARTAFARGMAILTGQTDIWVANGFDDESADIPTGMPLFFFYDCQDPDTNDSVRVSTNGYISFLQQGGGALDGTDYINDAIPNAGNTPNGFAAPWWDDLIVATSQGSTDRVSYKTEGAVDSRVFTVEWVSMTRLNGSTNDFHYFQVKLYETTDVIELHIGLDTSAWQTDTLDSATTGIENYTGAGGDCGPNCLNTNNPPPANDYRFTPFPRPDNDSCGNAIELINGASVTGNLHRATADGNANCGDSSNNRDVWYTFVARCNGTLRATTCGSRDLNGIGAGVDTVLSAHSGCPGTTANQLACSDDASATGCAATDSVITVPMVAGQRIYLRVTHFGDIAFRFGTGAFQLNLSFTSSSPPANDACAAATPILNGNSLVGTLLCASNDGSADCGSSQTNPDIWYVFNAARPGTLTIEACGTRNNAGTDTGPDTAIAIYSGCPGTLVNELACNDDGFQTGCNPLDSRVRAVLLAPGAYRIRVSHFGSDAFRVGNGLVIVRAVYACAGDWNQNGLIQPDDIAAFVNTWFASVQAGTLAGDFDGNGQVQPSDVALFVSLWFATLTAGGC